MNTANLLVKGGGKIAVNASPPPFPSQWESFYGRVFEKLSPPKHMTFKENQARNL